MIFYYTDIVMQIIKISDIKKYTIALYREINSELKLIGSGILVLFKGKYYLISAHHVFDSEKENERIQNDSDERDIPHDDLDSIFAKGKNEFFHINEYCKGVVWNANFDVESKQHNIDEDTEWCACILSGEMVRHFTEIGNCFYKIEENVILESYPIKTTIVSGYPKYAQKEKQEEYRSYRSEIINNDNSYKKDLVRVFFDNDNAFNYEKERYVKLPPKGIEGMSGGGIWGKTDDGYILIGIIIKQDPIERYIEGYRLDKIIEESIFYTY